MKVPDTMIRIKPYYPVIREDTVDSVILHQDHYGDKIRVFAKCISGGRPYDAVDIMIMTQSS